jgi:hypothetical protein
MSAERSWIAEPPPPSRNAVPGEERKWRIMMGNGQFLTEEDKDRFSKMKGAAELLPERPRNEGSKAAGLDPLPEDEST